MTLNLKLGLKKEDLLQNKVLLIGLAMGLISIWYGYNKIYSPVTASIKQINADISRENVNIDISRRLSVLQGRLASYKGYFAKETDILWLIDKVSKAAKDAGLEIISLKSQPLVPLRSFLYGTVNLTVRGTFHQLGDFVAKIESSKEFLRVERLSFKKDKDFLDADIVIGTYFCK